MANVVDAFLSAYLDENWRDSLQFFLFYNKEGAA